MNQLSFETDPYLAVFEKFEKGISPRSPTWIQAIRKGGIARFIEQGFPTPHHEEWRFTPVAPIARLPFSPILSYDRDGIQNTTVASFSFPKLRATQVVFIDGHYSEADSRVETSSGVRVLSLFKAWSETPELIEPYLGRSAPWDDHPFTALNSAFLLDGAVVMIPDQTILNHPIHLLFLSSCSRENTAIQPRNLIVLGKESQAKIIESYVSAGSGTSFTNVVTEIFLQDGAILEHCKFQDENPHSFHVAMIQIQQGRHSNLLTHSISTGARLARNDIQTVLGAENAECTMNGFYLVHGRQHVDHHTLIDHAKPFCNSHEYYNGILDGHAKGVFNGKIFVRKDAQKTDAKQTNRNLVLSEEASIDTKPQLEIYADDVKCTHGATVGQLDEEALFYLRSRGIGHDSAQRMLITAFAGDVLNRIRIEPVRERLERLLQARLAENPHFAENTSET